MTRALTERRITLAGLAVGLLILFALGTYAYQQGAEQVKQRLLFRESRDVIEQLHALYSLFRDAEAGQRGYLLTHDPEYLQPYHVAIAKIPPALDALGRMIEHDRSQQEQMATLRSLTDEKLSDLSSTLTAVREGSKQALRLVQSDQGKILMERLQTLLEKMRDREYEWVRLTDQRERDASRQAFGTILGGSLLAIILLGVATVLVLRDSRTKEQAERLVAQTKLVNLAPIMIRSPEGRIQFWSKGLEKLYGWTEEEAIGQLSHELLRTKFPVPLSEIQATLLNRGEWAGELTRLRQDGTEVVVSALWSQFKEGKRRPGAVVEVNTDITAEKRAQTALSESEHRFRLLADNMSQFAWTADETGSIVWYNRRWFDYTGTTLEEVQGWGWQKVLHPDHMDRVVHKLRRCVETGDVWEDTFPLRGRAGRYRWFLSRAIPIKSDDGTIQQWFGTNTDITELREAQEAQATLGAIVTSSDDAMISQMPDGIIMTWNTAAEELFGYSAAEMIGKPITTLVPDDRQDEERHMLAKIRAGEKVTQYETERLRKDESRRDVSVTVSSIRNAQGEIIGFSRICRDVTERKRAQTALVESEERFRTLTSVIPQLVWSWLPDGHCDYLSEQWLAYTGTTLEVNLGKGWLRLLHPDDVPHTVAAWEESVATGRPFSVEYRLRRHDDVYRWQLARAEPLRDETWTIVKWFGTTTDISAQKETAASLERINRELESRRTALAEANKELEAFSYSVSHDLRAPLRSITGFAEALLEDYGTKLEPEAVRYLNIISKGARQLGRLIDDLLAFSRLSRQHLEMSAVDLKDLVDEIKTDLGSEISQRTIEWTVADLPTCLADRTMIKLALANLLQNAIKYTRLCDVTRLEIAWESDDRHPGYARISVRDNGVGFDMQYANKLFTVFQRLHRAEDFEGTGVGLAIVQRIVHRHGGRVGGEGRVNGGATFWFTVRLAP